MDLFSKTMRVRRAINNILKTSLGIRHMDLCNQEIVKNIELSSKGLSKC